MQVKEFILYKLLSESNLKIKGEILKIKTEYIIYDLFTLALVVKRLNVMTGLFTFLLHHFIDKKHLITS